MSANLKAWAAPFNPGLDDLEQISQLDHLGRTACCRIAAGEDPEELETELLDALAEWAGIYAKDRHITESAHGGACPF